MIIDLRSDTFTKPTPAMLEAMLKAEVGDDVFGEDKSVLALESESAALFGMESGLFCPSGTMSNQIAIKCHTQPGNEVICDQLSHVYIYEGGGIAFNSSCQVRPLAGNLGKLSAEMVLNAINADDIHKPPTALVSLENTVNRGGGCCYDMNDLIQISEACKRHMLPLHLDGARIWNAMIARNEKPSQYGELFNSISICFSKGMGTPVGSVLLGSNDFIKKARRIRKVMGGGMRQAGYLAAAGTYALEHHFQRLQEDHDHAKQIGQALSAKAFVSGMLPVETNMLIFNVSGNYDAVSFVNYLKTHDIRCIAISSDQVRMVTHLDITPVMVQKLIAVIDEM